MSVQDVARMHHEGFNNRSFESNARNYIADNYIGVDEPTGLEDHGLEGYKRYARNWIAAFPDGKINVVNQQVSGNRVITSFRGVGTFNGQLQTPQGTVPGNGRRLDLEFHEELEIQNNKIVHSSTSYDMQEMMRQLGIQAQAR
jgi:predicted ester cyclase